MASDATIAQDGDILLQDGGAYSAIGPVYLPAVGLKYLLKRATPSEEAPTVSTRGWGDTQEYLRPLYAKATITMDIIIQDVGQIDIPIGNFIAATLSSSSSASSQTYEGILTKKSAVYEIDQVSMQTIELQGRRTS